MPYFDQTITVSAAPDAIFQYIHRTLSSDARLNIIRENVLATVYQRDLAFIYLVRVQPTGEAILRLIVEDQLATETIFSTHEVREAMQQIVGGASKSVASVTLDANRILSALKFALEPLQPLVSPAPNPSAAAPAASFQPGFSAAPLSTTDPFAARPPLEAVSPQKTLSFLEAAIIAVIIVVIFGVGILFAGTLAQRAAVYEDDDLRIAYGSSWNWSDLGNVPNCDSVQNFKCLMALTDFSPESTLVVLGSTVLPLGAGNLTLSQLEQISADALATQLKSFNRIKAETFKLNGHDAIRRYYSYTSQPKSTRITPLQVYGMQVYFLQKGKVYELSIESYSKADFDNRKKQITDLVNQVQFK